MRARVGLCVLCGLPAAGKSTLARALRRRLPQRPGWACALLDYDELIPPEAFGPPEPGAGPAEPSPLVSGGFLPSRSLLSLASRGASLRPLLGSAALPSRRAFPPGCRCRCPRGGAWGGRWVRGAFTPPLPSSAAAPLEAEPAGAAAVPGAVPAGGGDRGPALCPGHRRPAGLGALPGLLPRAGAALLSGKRRRSWPFLDTRSHA